MTTGPQKEPRPTRRGVLLGVGLAGLGGALAGCSTAAVPYDANEAGVVEGATASPMASSAPPGAASMQGSGSMQNSGGMQGTPEPSRAAKAKPKKDTTGAKLTGAVLGAASEIPVGGGKIYTAAKVVVTQPTRGKYNGFSAVCTHVGCIMSEVVNGTIDCPCHGAQFKITTGAVVTGPAPKPLPKKQIKVVDGKVLLA